MIQIMDARETDFDALRALRRQIHGIHVTNRPDVYEDTDPLTAGEYEEMRRNEKAVFLVALEDEQVIGYAFAVMRAPSENPKLKPRMVMYVEDLCVDLHRRRHGTGTALLDAVKREAVGRGAASMELMLWSFNESAKAFYSAYGMKERSVILEQKLMD